MVIIMFKPNIQMKFDPCHEIFDEKRLEKYLDSWEHFFYLEIFNYIDESDYMVLYSHEASRPNSPINVMVGALILLTAFEWTYEELFDNLDFHLLTRQALGLFDLKKTAFSVATLFNFQNKVMEYQVNTGIDLFEKTFKKLTLGQLDKFKIKTNIQRSDSFMVSSNIKSYGRLQLLVEVLIRFYKKLDAKEQKKFADKFESYLKYKTSGHFIYNLKKEQMPHEMEKIGKIYQELVNEYSEKYKDQTEYINLKRVYSEHFEQKSDGVKALDSKKLKSGSLQSPDDPTATYRKKNDKKHYGRVINLLETCNPNNEINLIIDVKTAANNKSDNEILNGQITVVKKMTPKLREIHTDAGYGSAENDLLMDKHKINHIQTAIKGRECDRTIEIERGVGRNTYYVSCPQQYVKAMPEGGKYEAKLDSEKCLKCTNKQCAMAGGKNKKCVYSFDKQDYLRLKRIKNIEKIPKNRKYLRNNIEATGREYRAMETDGKLKVRGDFKTAVFAILGAVAINFGRIYRKLMKSGENISNYINFYLNFVQKFADFFVKELSKDFIEIFPS